MKQIICFLILCLSVIGCTKDIDNNSDFSILGNWKLIEGKIINGTFVPNDVSIERYWEFKENGDMVYIANGSPKAYGTYKYDSEANTLTIAYNDDNGYFSVYSVTYVSNQEILINAGDDIYGKLMKVK